MCGSPQTACALRITSVHIWREQAIIVISDDWSLLLLAATVWSFARLLLGLSDRNEMMLWPGCDGRARCNLHKKKSDRCGSLWKRGDVVASFRLALRCTTNGISVKNNTHIYMWREQAIIVVYWIFARNLCLIFWSNTKIFFFVLFVVFTYMPFSLETRDFIWLVQLSVVTASKRNFCLRIPVPWIWNHKSSRQECFGPTILRSMHDVGFIQMFLQNG